MPDATGDDTSRRLTELEVKLSFAEDLLERLDAVVVRQQDRIDALQREVLRLREVLAGWDADAPRSLRDELPPHY